MVARGRARPRPSLPPWLRSRGTALWALVLAMAACGLLLAAGDVAGLADAGPPAPHFWLLLPVFAVAELLDVHLPTLRNAHTHTLREVPAVLGLVFLAPGEYVVAYVVAAGAALALVRRQRGVKLAFNVAMFGLEATLGLLTYQTVLGGSDRLGLLSWLAVFCAVLVTDLVSALAVTTAISLTEGRFDREVIREALGPGVVAAGVNTTLALVVVVMVSERPVALPLLLVVVGILVAAYRAHVALAAGYSRLKHLYRFVGATQRTDDAEQAVRSVLTDACEVLRAERAELVVLPGDDVLGRRLVLAEDGGLVEHGWDASPAWWSAAVAGRAVLLPAGAASGAPPDPGGPRDGMAAPLRSAGEVRGVLLVADRSFQGGTFTAEDLRLFETLAAHAAVAVEKALLLDRLRRLAAEREREARQDSLTGLPNRRAFYEAVDGLVDGLVDGPGEGSGRGAVLVLDLDDFKDVNDTLGHDAGDALLCALGLRLQEASGGTVARLGGDEFAVLLPEVDEQEALLVARRLHRCVAETVSLGAVDLQTSVSVGVALLPCHGSRANDVLRHADVAMYGAKQARTGVELYRPEDGAALARKLALAGDLPRAVETGGFTLVYQPQADALTGAVVGVEALLRWQHPEHGFVPPPEVVALAERIGCGRQLTDAVLARALHRRAAWAATGLELDVSVNVTVADLCDDGLPDVVADLLLATGTPARALTVEITEQGLMADPDRCLAVLDRLSALGVQLSLDDFGTGYSSLAYLERLPVDEVKVDRSFISRLDHGDADLTVLQATVTLAHDLGKRVVAEGVETVVAWQRTAALGCEVVQGFGLARPLPEEELEQWLQARRGGAPPAQRAPLRSADRAAT